MKLFFNPNTQSVVLYHNNTYYDMRNGNTLNIEGKLPILNSFKSFTKSKWEEPKGKYPTQIGNHRINIKNDNGKIQFSGKFPRYFWKGFINLVNKGVFK